MKLVKDILPFVITIVILIILRIFIITPIQVVGSSMVPNLSNGELMILDKVSYRFNEIKRFDIVVINKNNEKAIIKRVIGLPGERVEIRNNTLYINGKKIEQDFKVNGITEDFSLKDIDEEIIPENYYFVLGDNRINSVDSRIIGLVSEDDIEGKAFFVLYPFNRFGKID